MTTPTEGASCARTRIFAAGNEPTGELRIRAQRIGVRTVLTEAYRTAPFHLGMPHEQGGRAHLIIQGVGPGYLPGDRINIDMNIEENADTWVRGQGATRLYPSPQGEAATAVIRLTVAAGGRLIYLPGELIPYRQAVLDQRTVIEVARGGRCMLGEIVTPGRMAMGEIDAYTRLRLDVGARVDGRLVLLERARLEPGSGALTSIGRHGSYAVSGTLYVIGEPWDVPDDLGIPDGVLWSSASGEGYTFIRLLGPTAQAVSGALISLIR